MVYGRCVWQSIYIIWFGGTSWGVNAITSVEVFRLLKASKMLANYIPPSRSTVLLRCLGVWLLNGMLAAIVFFPQVPHKPLLVRGLMCLPVADGTQLGRSLTFILVVMPLNALIPSFVTFVIGVLSLTQRLLHFDLERRVTGLNQASEPPRTSRALHEMAAYRERVAAARSLFIYFARVFLGLLVWYPTFIVLLLGLRPVAPFVVGMSLISLQSCISSLLALTKSDVRHATRKLFQRCIPGAKASPPKRPVAGFSLDPRKQLAIFGSKSMVQPGD